MAASIPAIQERENFTEEFLTCSICTEPYDNGLRQAKCLPCLHTYCKCCLQKHAREQSEFNCPNCRCQVTLPEGSVDNLPNNFLVNKLKDYEHSFNFSSMTCGGCSDEALEGNQAIGFCHDCGTFLCQTCTEQHRIMRPLQHHKLSTLAELQGKKQNPVVQQCLADHRDHDLVDFTAATANLQQVEEEDRNDELARKRAASQALTINYDGSEEKWLDNSTWGLTPCKVLKTLCVYFSIFCFIVLMIALVVIIIPDDDG